MPPIGLKPPPKHAPKRVESTADLRAFQRLMMHALVRPLGSAADVAADLIKPNSRLTALERLEIYHRMYWYRLLDCVADDSPGLASLLGEDRFDRLVRAYLAKYPSRSFTLRNLCSRLPRFIREEPRWTAPQTALAFDVARFEWAQTQAYDGEERPLLAPVEIARAAPARLKVALQPCLSVLSLDFPVDDFVIAVKRRNALRDEASNARETKGPAGRRVRRIAPPRRGRVYVAVYRLKGRLHYLRLAPAGFRILEAIGAGLPLARAVAAGGRVRPDQVREWFATWMKLGWFCSTSPR
jgi:hypothetical protein